MPLSEQYKKHLRGLGHKLKPVVRVGHNGLSDNIFAELVRALRDHELVKVKISAEDRAEREGMIATLCERGDCELVQKVGGMALLYRRNRKKPVIIFP